MNEFRIRLETKDGCLVQNRKGDGSYYDDPKFVTAMLTRDCCENGVRLLSYEKTETGIVGIVEWLK